MNYLTLGWPQGEVDVAKQVVFMKSEIEKMPEVMPPVTLIIRVSAFSSIWLWRRSGSVRVSVLISPFRSSPSRQGGNAKASKRRTS